MRVQAILRSGVLGLILAAALPASVEAGSFVISPVRLDLADNHRSEVLTLNNSDTEPLTVQLHLVTWSQANGEDSFGPADDLLATPPVFQVPPKGSQVIRVAMRHPLSGPGERTYRLFVEEVPPQVATTGGAAGVHIALRMSIPIFYSTPGLVAGPLKFSAQRTGNEVQLTARNAGTEHVRIVDFHVKADDSTIDSLPLSYVLSGSERSWTVPTKVAEKARSTLHVSATTDEGKVDEDVPVSTSH